GMAVSWAGGAGVGRGGVGVGLGDGQAGTQVDADERVYTDALTGETVFTYHARIASLEPGTRYAYQILHGGSAPVPGTFTTGPRGRSGPFRFTSFGDHAIPGPVGEGVGPHSPNAGYLVTAAAPL